MITRRCASCREDLPTESFYDPSRSYCKPCTRAKRKDSYRKNGEVERVREANWARYGITREQYERAFEIQSGACAICRYPTPGRALCVDHDHETGRVRALLCTPCNTLVGACRENPDILVEVGRYLSLFCDRP